jgi:chromosome segregation ATPase
MTKGAPKSVLSAFNPSPAINSATKENVAGTQLTATQLQSLYDTLESRTQESQLLRRQISLKDKELTGLKAELEDVSDMLAEIERNVAHNPSSIKSSLAKVAAKKRSNDSDRDTDYRIANLRQELAKRDEAILVQQKKVESLQELNLASKSEIERIVSYGEQLQADFDNLTLEKNELEGKLEETKESRDKQIKTLVEELEKRAALLKQYREMLGEFEEEDGEIMVDGKRYSDLKLEAEKVQHKLESLERAHRDAKESLKHLSSEKTDMEER